MTRLRRAGLALLAALALAVLAACSYPVRNQEAAVLDEAAGYRPDAWPDRGDERSFFVVTASGGGTRAAALAMGALQALGRLETAQGSVLDEVDMVSSVSGGSVAAAQYALHGEAGFQPLYDEFLVRDGIGRLLWAGLNPVGLARLATPSYARIDPLIEYFREALYGEASFATLMGQDGGPFLVLNAADMAQGTAFPFTQRQFDLLCSDLARLDLATAVAASAAFPVALSPVTLNNYTPCAAQAALGGRWPPAWWRQDDHPANRYLADIRMRQADDARPYLNLPGEPHVGYVHLLDGGIADNLGLLEPLRIIRSQVVPRMLAEPDRRIVLLLVNARSDPDSELSASPAVPGLLDMFFASTNAAVDNASFGRLDAVRALLDGYLGEVREVLRAQGRPVPPDPILIPVDFDYIADKACRRGFRSIATSWTLERGEVDALLEVAAGLVRQAPEYGAMLAHFGATDRGNPDVAQACRTLDAVR